jgi:hypothetical protein
MDELTLVARLREDLPAGFDLTGPERRLAAEISAAATPARGPHGPSGPHGPLGPHGPRSARGTRGARGHGRRLVVVAAVAASVAAAAVIIAQGRTARPGPEAAGPTRPSAAPAPAASAAELVSFATRAAAAGPAFNPRPHQWIYTKVLQASSSAGGGGYLFGPPNERVTVKSWQRVDGQEIAYLQHGRLVIAPSGLPRVAHGKVANAGATPLGWPNASYPYLESLPTNPAQLMAVIEANLKAEANPLGADGEGNIGVFNAIQALMENVVLPPRLQAGLYGVLARDPAVRFDRSVTDIAGRPGVGFYTVQEGYLKDEIVINPRTYAYMGYQDVAIRAHTSVGTDMTAHFRRGQILGWQARLQSGIVQRAGQLP